ncbi:hypothetical protein O6H91_Y266500 [Diphasiastrum complanatum]|nr:hypothetical protein O6H91_Y266500 [Diphasiastrum complanatum]
MGLGVGLVYDKRMCAHANPYDPSHPEKPARLTSIVECLNSSGALQRCVRVEAREATDEELASVHTHKHIAIMRAVSSRSYGREGRAALARRYSSIYFNEGSTESALLAAGSTIELSINVAENKFQAGAAVVRPPGHHAEADAAMGFCLFNNVGIAAHVLVHGKPELGIRRLLIVDWDVHHGNGTQNMFWEDPQVLYFSVHRYDNGAFYPGGDGGSLKMVGGHVGAGFNINVPWPHGGYGDADYLAVWDNVLLPVTEAFKPDLILISGGFDSAEGDPLGGCCLTPNGYSQLTHKLMDFTGGKVVLVLEGGYNLKSIAKSYLACLNVLLGDPPLSYSSTRLPFQSTWDLIKEIRQELSKFWPILGMEIQCLQGLEKLELRPSLKEEASYSELSDGVSSGGTEEEWTSISALEGSQKDLIELLAQLTTGPENQNDFPDAASNSLVTEHERVDMETGEKEDDDLGGEVELRHCKDAGEEPTFAKRTEVGYNSPLIAPGIISDPGITYVWYAAYGSNMWKPRFMCYIHGGQAEGMSISNVGSCDKCPPVAEDWLVTPHRMFFGHTKTKTWGLGGVSFLDPFLSDGGESTYLRLYKITLQQFFDVLAQENCIHPENGQSWISESSFDSMKKGLPSTPGSLVWCSFIFR